MHLQTGRSIEVLVAAHGVSENWLFKALGRGRLEAAPDQFEPGLSAPDTKTKLLM